MLAQKAGYLCAFYGKLTKCLVFSSKLCTALSRVAKSYSYERER